MIPFVQERAVAPPFTCGRTDRFAAAAQAGCQGGRCVWTHDFAPARNSALRDIASRVVIGVPNEATPNTNELRLAAATSLVDMPTRVTCPRGEGRVDLRQRQPGQCRLVPERLPELTECPGVQRGPLGLAKPYPCADPRQPFDGDPASGAFSHGHDVLADLVVQVGCEAGILASIIPQQSPRGGRVFGLQARPHTLLPGSVPIQSAARDSIAVAGCGDVHDPQIHADKSVDRWFVPHLRGVDNGMQQPLAVLMDQVGLADGSASQQSQMFGLAQESQVANSTGHGPNRHGRFAAGRWYLPGEASSVEGLSGFSAERDGFRCDLPAAIRTGWPVSPGSHVRPQRGVGSHGLADNQNRQLRGQPEPSPQFQVEPFLDFEPVGHVSRVHLGGQPGGRVVASGQRRLQRRRLIRRRQQPQPDRLLHADQRIVGHRQNGEHLTGMSASDVMSAMWKATPTRPGRDRSGFGRLAST